MRYWFLYDNTTGLIQPNGVRQAAANPWTNPRASSSCFQSGGQWVKGSGLDRALHWMTRSGTSGSVACFRRFGHLEGKRPMSR